VLVFVSPIDAPALVLRRTAPSTKEEVFTIGDAAVLIGHCVDPDALASVGDFAARHPLRRQAQ